MVDFVIFNFSIAFIDILLMYIITKSETIKVIKPKGLYNNVKFLMSDITIYICIFILFSLPILNVIVLFIITKELFKSFSSKTSR